MYQTFDQPYHIPLLLYLSHSINFFSVMMSAYMIVYVGVCVGVAVGVAVGVFKVL